jgi:hypothetical protein
MITRIHLRTQAKILLRIQVITLQRTALRIALRTILRTILRTVLRITTTILPKTAIPMTNLSF